MTSTTLPIKNAFIFKISAIRYNQNYYNGILNQNSSFARICLPIRLHIPSPKSAQHVDRIRVPSARMRMSAMLDYEEVFVSKFVLG